MALAYLNLQSHIPQTLPNTIARLAGIENEKTSEKPYFAVGFSSLLIANNCFHAEALFGRE